MSDSIVVLQAYHIFVIMLGGGAVVTRPNKEITSALLPELSFQFVVRPLQHTNQEAREIDQVFSKRDASDKGTVLVLLRSWLQRRKKEI